MFTLMTLQEFIFYILYHYVSNRLNTDSRSHPPDLHPGQANPRALLRAVGLSLRGHRKENVQTVVACRGRAVIPLTPRTDTTKTF